VFFAPPKVQKSNLVGSRLTVVTLLRLLLASLAVNLAVLASLGPIVAFFSVSTTSYRFMVLLNVLVFTISGLLGLTFLLQTLNRLSIAKQKAEPPPQPLWSAGESHEAPPASEATATESPSAPPAEIISAEPAEEPGALERLGEHVLGEHVKKVFVCWMVVFGLVGTQMSWVLRPFIGAPGTKFQWFRERGSNFFESVFELLVQLFS
jgi:hypothetical protein